MTPHMPKDAKIYVAGHKGLVGSAIIRSLKQQEYTYIIGRTSSECDLTQTANVNALFEEESPDYVFVAAAKVGGIHANNTYPVDFLHNNLMIQQNIINAAARHKVKRLIFLGSSCIYPRACPQPIREEHLLSGPLEPTNQPYAIAKIAGVELCWAYNRQYNTRFMAAMPTNIYGPGDNYHLENSHVIPAILRKMHQAKVHKDSTVTLWGSGEVRREFLYSEDLSRGLIHLMNLSDTAYSKLLDTDPSKPPLINVGSGSDITIKELAEAIKHTVGYSGEIVWDSSRPDGTPQKLLESSKINQSGWQAKISLKEGLQLAYEDVLANAGWAQEPCTVS